MWITRDKDGTLALFNDLEKPFRIYDKKWEGYNFCYLNKSLFPDLTWKDEPLEIEIISKKELEELRYKASQAPTVPYMGRYKIEGPSNSECSSSLWIKRFSR